jgi:hypothetical protein
MLKYSHISEGVHNNVLVYDCDACPGVFTKRLVKLMKNTFKEQFNINLEKIFLSNDSLIDLDYDIVLNNDLTVQIFDVQQAIDNGYRVYLYGVELIAEPKLKRFSEFDDFYKNKLEGSLMSGDIELAIGMGKNKVLLGSF